MDLISSEWMNSEHSDLHYQPAQAITFGPLPYFSMNIITSPAAR